MNILVRICNSYMPSSPLPCTSARGFHMIFLYMARKLLKRIHLKAIMVLFLFTKTVENLLHLLLQSREGYLEERRDKIHLWFYPILMPKALPYFTLNMLKECKIILFFFSPEFFYPSFDSQWVIFELPFWTQRWPTPSMKFVWIQHNKNIVLWFQIKNLGNFDEGSVLHNKRITKLVYPCKSVLKFTLNMACTVLPIWHTSLMKTIWHQRELAIL